MNASKPFICWAALLTLSFAPGCFTDSQFQSSATTQHSEDPSAELTREYTVNAGADQAFAITPLAGYQTADVWVDGVSVGPVSVYTFTQVQANHTIKARFVRSP